MDILTILNDKRNLPRLYVGIFFVIESSEWLIYESRDLKALIQFHVFVAKNIQSVCLLDLTDTNAVLCLLSLTIFSPD